MHSTEQYVGGVGGVDDITKCVGILVQIHARDTSYSASVKHTDDTAAETTARSTTACSTGAATPTFTPSAAGGGATICVPGPPRDCSSAGAIPQGASCGAAASKEQKQGLRGDVMSCGDVMCVGLAGFFFSQAVASSALLHPKYIILFSNCIILDNS